MTFLMNPVYDPGVPLKIKGICGEEPGLRNKRMTLDVRKDS